MIVGTCSVCKEGWGPPEFSCACTRAEAEWFTAYVTGGLDFDVDNPPTCSQTVDSGASQDQVNSPSHYRQGEIECIDAMKAQATPEEFKGHLRLNCAKYLWRYNHKGNALEDLKKARWYLDRLIGEVE